MSWMTRAALAAILGLGLSAGLARAQGPGTSAPPVAPPMADPTPWGIIDGLQVQSASPRAANSAYAIPAPETKTRRLSKYWPFSSEQKHGCWSHHNAYLCSSWHSEKIFIFGSCRQFFGEPCFKNPPPGYPLPGGAAAGSGGSGCANCR